MADIKDFDTLKTVVEDMTKHKTELGISGVFASTSLQSGEDWRWQTHLANIPVYYEFLKENKDINDPSAIKEIAFKYSDNFKNIFDLYINNSTTDKKLLGSKQVADSMAEFALGQCVMVQNGNWAWSQINDIKGNVGKKEDVKFMPIYTGMDEDSRQGLCIGTENFLCINAKATEEEREMAADFLYWLYSSDRGKEFVTEKLNFITPFDTFDESERSSDPLSLQVSEWIEREDITTIPWNFTLFPSQSFKQDFGSALLQYAQGNMTWEQVKEIFVSRWKAESGA
jgi:raffinose/stachyose/melibiose transport system substrate-binding protein